MKVTSKTEILLLQKYLIGRRKNKKFNGLCNNLVQELKKDNDRLMPYF